MPPGLPGADVKFLANVVNRLYERRLHVYCPGAHRSAAALVLRFDESTRYTLREALASFRAASRQRIRSGPSTAVGPTCSSSCTAATIERGGAHLHAVELLRHLSAHCVDPEAPSTLQLLLLKRADTDASRWTGQVAFPGGRRDPEDADDFQAVCREAQDGLGLPLQHSDAFVCLGRMRDYVLHRSGVVQARFVFLHVGDMTPTVHVAAREVESVRWMPLHRLTAAHVEHGCVVHPLRRLLRPQDVGFRLLLAELFPSTYLTFPSVALPSVELGDRESIHAKHMGASASLLTWRVWGPTLRSANELLALDNRQPFGWPLAGSNSLVLRCCVLFPFHGYYELLYQCYYWWAWLGAQGRLLLSRYSATNKLIGSDASAKARRVLHGSEMERRYLVLPLSADALLFAAPEQPVLSHVVCLLGVMAAAVLLLFAAACAMADLFSSVRLALSAGTALEREERRRAYYDTYVRGNSRTALGGRSASEFKGDATTREREGDGDGSDASAGTPLTEAQHPPVDEALQGDKTASLPSTLWRQRGGGRPAQANCSTADEAALAIQLGKEGVPPESTSDRFASPTTAATTLRVRHDAASSLEDAAAVSEAVPAGPVRSQVERVELRRALEKDHAAELLSQPAPMRLAMTHHTTPTQAVLPPAPAGVSKTSYEDELQAVMRRYRGD
ncbi:hypothetical protein ABL78_2216 [Leptomonas seymouri]|uniref:Nudix hydrolase domain-containing protein n=1 Tax=Leptomonas seymouri TaxID=5684 RepID=A0A0N1I6E0_LEPSE|nr:hypothetical protein ABL78_2216 [Leptomonas seymouri]|eukprot:KPI88678.1 hypothetical protein ABL78_2216 [Leptomonas seymouri]